MKVRRRNLSIFILTLLFISFVPIFQGDDNLARAGEVDAEDSSKDNIKELKGMFRGSSSKARLISIKVDERTVLIPYNDETSGLDEVSQNDNVILRYRESGEGRIAVEVAPLVPGIPDGVQEIDIEELMAIIKNPPEQHGYLLVDCRPAEFYAETHLPTAVSIPWTESEKRKAALLPKDKETQLIFYCLGTTCLLGPNSAAIAAEAGYKNIRVFLPELTEWQEEGGHLYSTDRHVAEGNIVLVDLRNSAEAEAGHIPRAVNIPVGDLKEAVYDFPPKKSAPIVLYGADAEVAAAVEIIRGWGYSTVSMVEGGYGGWIMRGNRVDSGRMSSTPDWQRVPDEGEIPLKDFMNLLESDSPEVMIIDVRAPSEVAKGKLKNSVHIPLNELEGRLAEIPEDREVVLHCTTGARAQMAYSYLKQFRNGVRYLQAKVVCKGEKCRVKP